MNIFKKEKEKRAFEGKIMSDSNLHSINSCIELSEIRKLDKLLSQCEIGSCESILFSDNCSTFRSLDRIELSDISLMGSAIMDKQMKELHHSSTVIIGAHAEEEPNCECLDSNNIDFKTQSCSNLERNKKLNRTDTKKYTSLDQAQQPPQTNQQPLSIVRHTKPSLKKQQSIDYHRHNMVQHDGDKRICKTCGNYYRDPEKMVKIKSTEIDIKVIVDNPDDDYDHLLSSKYSSQTSIKEYSICNRSERNSFMIDASSPTSQYNAKLLEKQPSTTTSIKSRSKLTSQILAKKIARKASSNAEDGEKSVKESLLGHCRVDSFHIEKKLPETVETVCIFMLKFCFSNIEMYLYIECL